jgi:hypothetical protein
VRKTSLGLAVVVGFSGFAGACGGTGAQTLTPTAPSTSTSAAASTAASTSPASEPASQPAASPQADLLFGCEMTDHYGFVLCIHDHINPTDTASAFEVTKRVAWALRGEGAGLLIKNDGENVVSWQGHNFSAGRICYPDGSLMKVVTDVGAGGVNGASWTANGSVDPSLYVPAISPEN